MYITKTGVQLSNIFHTDSIVLILYYSETLI